MAGGIFNVLSSNKIMSGLLDTQQYRQELLTNIEAKERGKACGVRFLWSVYLCMCVFMYVSLIYPSNGPNSPVNS